MIQLIGNKTYILLNILGFVDIIYYICAASQDVINLFNLLYTYGIALTVF